MKREAFDWSKYPIPWRIERHYTEFDDGGSLSVILDANDEIVVTDYWGDLDFIWSMYVALRRER